MPRHFCLSVLADCVNRKRAGFRQQLAAALRSDSVPAVTPSALHFFRSPTPDRSQFKMNLSVFE
jgi:hypothetical protein